MAKTVVQKVDSPDPDVTIFKINGTLGFHENPVLVKFFDECSSRNIRTLILDFADLGSLGGGCAKIIREAAESGIVRVCIVGASKTVQNFLQGKGGGAVCFAEDVGHALEDLRKKTVASAAGGTGQTTVGVGSGGGKRRAAGSKPSVRSSAMPATLWENDPLPAASGASYAEDILIEVDDLLGDPSMPEPDPPATPDREPGEASKGPRPLANTGSPAANEGAADPKPARPAKAPTDGSRELKRQLIRYRALFSLNKEFSRIEDKSRLLDAFLLTIVAQVGVESAAFLELDGEEFTAVCWKGFETADPKSLSIRCGEVQMNVWLGSSKIFPLSEAPISAAARARVEKWDLPFAAPFLVQERFRGIVLLGRPIRQALDADSWEFLSMMFDQVAIAYENSCRLEKQSERTLGLVQSLISMIENNTVSRGTTEMVMDLAYSVALKMHYPEEHMRDLLYGVVLRDIGMINTGTLFVRSPRELVQEEWDIIKQHPSEGASMLEKMGFSKHACDVVLSHHERYNGEGYPNGLTAAEISLGGRILSVVESYAAMVHDRPNRPALTRDEALSTLEENWGLRYDPEVVNVFVQIIEEEVWSGARAKHRGLEFIKS